MTRVLIKLLGGAQRGCDWPEFCQCGGHQIDDFETPTVVVKTFADLRQMPKLTEHESGSRMVAAVRWKGDGQAVCHFVSRHAARDQPRSIIAPHGFRFASARATSTHALFRSPVAGSFTY